ncbi:MAG TPA: hypothetical protein VE079_12190 [Ensifer sp.]|nr:hypothetical protein [Ensifer sp.]
MSVHTQGRRAASSTDSSSKIQYVRCVGSATLTSPLARDVGCLIDVDDSVSAWACRRLTFQSGFEAHKPAIVAESDGGIVVIDVVVREVPPAWVADVVVKEGYVYKQMSRGDLDPVRLKNARDLLRYSAVEVPLGDRIRLLAGLDEHGTLSLAECLSAFRETIPIGGLASLILQRFVEVDLDTLISPETLVRRYRG